MFWHGWKKWESVNLKWCYLIWISTSKILFAITNPFASINIIYFYRLWLRHFHFDDCKTFISSALKIILPAPFILSSPFHFISFHLHEASLSIIFVIKKLTWFMNCNRWLCLIFIVYANNVIMWWDWSRHMRHYRLSGDLPIYLLEIVEH